MWRSLTGKKDGKSFIETWLEPMRFETEIRFVFALGTQRILFDEKVCEEGWIEVEPAWFIGKLVPSLRNSSSTPPYSEEQVIFAAS